MCELFGYSAKEEQDFTAFPETRLFFSHSVEHPDGWGIGWYTRKAALVKEAKGASESKLLEDVLSIHLVTSSLVVAHIRYASIGEVSYKNTHPFLAERGVRQWFFAHNGTLASDKLTGNLFFPKGTTDSELAFYWLLHRIHEKDDEESSIVAKSAAFLQTIGKANFLLTDGNVLYAYADTKLHYLQRKGLVMVSTQPLNDCSWTRMKRGELLVCRDGEIVEKREQKRK